MLILLYEKQHQTNLNQYLVDNKILIYYNDLVVECLYTKQCKMRYLVENTNYQN